MAEDDAVVGEVVDHGEGVDVDAAVAVDLAAALEDLFDGDADAGDLGAALFAEVHESVQCLAFGEEVVDDEDVVLGGDESLVYADVVFNLLGVGEDLGVVGVVGQGLGEVLHGTLDVLGPGAQGGCLS